MNNGSCLDWFMSPGWLISCRAVVTETLYADRTQCSDLTPIFIGMHRNAPLSLVKEGAWVQHSYGSYEPRKANPSTDCTQILYHGSFVSCTYYFNARP